MKAKVFISYAHKDEDFKNELIEHLSILKRTNMIEEWNDRKITAGQEWDKEISMHLEKADIILFLVSASFINSDYCYDIEVKRAIEKHESKDAILIPIVIRAVNWSGTDFSKIQGLPKDALAVSSWENRDEAWVDVVEGIKKSINNLEILKPKKKEIVVVDRDITFDVSEKQIEWLYDTELVLTHRRKNKVLLSDVFIFPDLRVFNDKNSTSEVISSDILTNPNGKYLISGEEQQGKTTLLKQVYINLEQNNILPIYKW